MSDHPPSALFSQFCELLQSLSDIRGTQEKKKRLTKYLYNWRAQQSDDFYPAMRLLLPHLDKSRYGLKEAKLAKAYIDALGLGKTSEDAYHLTNWKLPGSSTNTRSVGDFAAIAYETIKSRSTVMAPTQTITDVNVLLDELDRSGSNDKKKSDIFKRAVHIYTPIEQRWMIRIILKDLKIGMSENSVLDVYHHQARELFSVCSNLKKVCEDLKDPFANLGKSTIQLFQSFKPQLGHKDVPTNVSKIQADGRFYIEDKIDGERMQMHFEKSSRSFRWYSRKATDYTYLYGDSPFEAGKLSGNVYEGLMADSLILDGEMVAYDPKAGVYLPFGSLKTSAKDATLDPHKSRPCFVVFDIVYCNGAPLLDFPLCDRLQILNSVVKETHGYLDLLPRLEKSTFDDIVQALDKAIVEGKEGLVIKNPSSIYEPGVRNIKWIKLKPEYIGSLRETCDLVVVGGKYGTGIRANKVAQFLCAVRDDRIPEESEPRFLTFVVVGTGFTIDELGEFSKFFQNFKRYNAKRQPSWLVHPPGSTETPDVIIHYEDALVIEVKASSITHSISFGSQSTLRFPIFVGFRPDKSWKDIMTYTEMVATRKGQGSGSQKRSPASQQDFLNHSKKKRVKGSLLRSTRKYSLLADQLGLDASSVARRSSLFDNLTFYVVKGCVNTSKNDLERMIVENGGNFVQTDQNVNFIVAGAKNITVNSLLYRQSRDIIIPQWVVDCTNNQDLIPLVPKYMLFTTERTKQLFAERMDRWGDSYTDDATEKSIREIFSDMAVDTSDTAKARALCDEIHARYFNSSGIPGLMFQRIRAYVDVDVNDSVLTGEHISKAWVDCQRRNDKLRLASINLRFRGAATADKLEEGVTHVVMDKNHLENLSTFLQFFRGKPQPRIVVWEWVDACVRNKGLLDEKGKSKCDCTEV